MDKSNFVRSKDQFGYSFRVEYLGGMFHLYVESKASLTDDEEYTGDKWVYLFKHQLLSEINIYMTMFNGGIL